MSGLRNEDRFNELFEELVPACGKADSLAGEILRAVGRIVYRFYNDGDLVNVGYGKETCNAAARFLSACGTVEVSALAKALFVVDEEDAYEGVLSLLVDAAVHAVDDHPELRKAETQDMFDWFDEEKDTDYGDDWEDDEGCL